MKTKPSNAQQQREEKRREGIKESLRQLRELWGKTPCTPKK